MHGFEVFSIERVRLLDRSNGAPDFQSLLEAEQKGTLGGGRGGGQWEAEINDLRASEFSTEDMGESGIP